MADENPALQKLTDVDLIVDQVLVNGEFVFKKDKSTITVAKWLADSMVSQGVAKIKGVK